MLCVTASVVRADQPASPKTGPAKFQWGVQIPLRDSVKLSATVYTPREQKEPAPCIFTLTPYMAQSYHDRGMYFAAHGYPFLTVDVRGRGDSEGEFRPLIQEARDGYDVVEWLAQQPYCNGKVTMWGGSYAGYDQWVTAKEFPPHLATIVPVASPYVGVDFPMRANISYPYAMRWLTFTSGNASQERIFGDETFWRDANRRWFESGSPFKEFDTLVGNPSKTFQEWVAHPQVDDYWDSYNPTAEQYAKLSLPILSITGSYDGDQLGALEHYRQHMKHGTEAAKAQHYLVIGPWNHAGTRTPEAEFGGLKFGPASLVDLPKLHLEWYAWTMQGGPKPEFLQKRVAYYVMDTDSWRYADTLEAITAQSRAYFLDSNGSANDVLASGSLAETQPKGKPDQYVYDPRDVSIAAIEDADMEAFTDQRAVYASRGKHLVYHTAPFERDTEISGFFKLSAWLAIDQPDTDFDVSVYEIRRDGSSIFLSNDQKRARYRESVREAKLIKTREPLEYDFDGFSFTSRMVRKGSRLRLVIGPLNSINIQKNFNSGGDISSETLRDARPVTVKLFHDRAHPTTLFVPIGQP
ncbi:CocE/NonD family hydrolase [Steroidobacter sp.]|uniref:CocE/NonD family hydrolase n=1 Tax=Steroidobacter sp. TaxID=1978227 RepID=UPI002EDAFFD6